MKKHRTNNLSARKPINSIGKLYKSTAGVLLVGMAVTANAGTSTNTAGPVYQGTSDGNTAADYAAGNYTANNPAVTISFSGQTALRTFDTTPGITELNPGTSIILHDGTNGAPVTYTAPSTSGEYFQLASNDFTQQDYYPTSPTNNYGANLAQNSALRLEWHEQGSVDGEYDLINDEVGYIPVSSGGTGPISNEALRTPSVSNPTWINTNTFNASTGSTKNGFYLDNSTSDNLANTYDPTVYNQATGVNLQGGQNRIQFSVGEYKTEGLSVSGTPSVFATAGSPGYGLGNPAIASASTYTALGVAGKRQQFQPQSIVNESTNKIDPQTGQAYPTGPWNSAGANNINSTQIAVTAVGFTANPGTGLEHLNLADTQWLQTTGRLQNGAVFNFVARTVDTGQRIVAAQNTGIDPSWAVGTNDDGNSTSSSAATAQHSIGSSLRFSGKTAGSEAAKTIGNSRMAVGVLSLPETLQYATNAAPLRNLNIDFNAADGYSTNPSNFIKMTFDSIVSDGVTPINIPGDPNDGTVVPRYQAILISQYNTIKSPNLAFQNDTASQWAAAQSFDPSTAETDSTPAGTVTGIKGDTTGDVAAFISNIVNSIGTGAAGLGANSSKGIAVNNPADSLFINGFLTPSLLNYSRVYDGGPITSVQVSSGLQTVQGQVESNYGSLFTADGSYGSNSQTIGSGATYGANGTNSLAVNGSIPITAKTFDGVNASSVSSVSDGTLAPAGNYLFGNFNQNGVRDLAAVEQAVNAALSLYAVDGAKNSMFTADGGVPNNTVIPSLVGTPGWVTTSTNTKGDLIALGDYNGDGKFDGQDLYQLAVGASLTSANSSTGLNATYLTFADALRDPTDILRKNAALDYINNYLNTTSATAGAAFLRQTARSVLTVATSGTAVPAGATDLHTTDPVTGLEQFSYDPTGAYAFDKHDVNRDGVVDFNDAILVDQYYGQSYENLTQQLAATEPAPVTGVTQSVSLTVVQQIDGESAIGSADLTQLNTGLTGAGNTNWYGYALNKTGPGTITWARTGGTVTVYSGAGLQISSGTVHVASAIDPFTDSSATGTDVSKSLSVLVSGGTLEYTSESTAGIQLDRLAGLNISSGQVVLDPASNHSNRTLLLTGNLTLSGTGKLDLGTNDLDIQSGTLSTVVAYIKQAYNGGGWNGAGGITSSSAAGDPAHLLALGVIQNNQGGSTLFNGSHHYDGITPGAADILVKSTYYGDANLDGQVTSADYTLIDAGYLSHGTLTGWLNGDFNYDNVINGSDYTLIDNAFNTQGASLASAIAGTEVASPTAQVAGSIGATSVPEPVTTGLIGATAALGLLGRRRRRLVSGW
jgi:hypothetical protein